MSVRASCLITWNCFLLANDRCSDQSHSQLDKQVLELAFVIIEDRDMVGRIGFSKIDVINKIGEIGYWLAEDRQGRGIIRKSTKRLLDYGFEELKLERIEIRPAVQNTKSQSIPEALGFRLEKILAQAEVLHGRYVDHFLYVLEKPKYGKP